MNLFRKAIVTFESMSELPRALRACVELAREADSNQQTTRARDAFDGVCEGGPALYSANSQITEMAAKIGRLEQELAHRSRAFDAQADEIDADRRRAAELAFKLKQEQEARRHRLQNREPAPFSARVLEFCANGTVCVCDGKAVASLSTWRYLSPEDMP